MTDQETTTAEAPSMPPFVFQPYDPERSIRETALHHATTLYGDAAEVYSADSVTRAYIDTADAIAAWLRDGTKPAANTERTTTP